MAVPLLTHPDEEVQTFAVRILANICFDSGASSAGMFHVPILKVFDDYFLNIILMANMFGFFFFGKWRCGQNES